MFMYYQAYIQSVVLWHASTLQVNFKNVCMCATHDAKELPIEGR